MNAPRTTAGPVLKKDRSVGQNEKSDWKLRGQDGVLQKIIRSKGLVKSNCGNRVR